MNDVMSDRALNDHANDYDVHDHMNGLNEASAVDESDVFALDVCTCRIRNGFRLLAVTYIDCYTTIKLWQFFVVAITVDSNCDFFKPKKKIEKAEKMVKIEFSQ